MALSGVRNSWLILAKKVLLAWLAASAILRACSAMVSIYEVCWLASLSSKYSFKFSNAAVHWLVMM